MRYEVKVDPYPSDDTQYVVVDNMAETIIGTRPGIVMFGTKEACEREVGRRNANS